MDDVRIRDHLDEIALHSKEIHDIVEELSTGGYFSDCEDVQQVEEFDWPDPDYLNFSEVLNRLQNIGDVFRASGFWCPFFHDVADFLGMDNYFLKMYTHPQVVHAITGRIVDFYLEAKRRLFTQAGELIDGLFFVNDFGTQLDLLISPEMLGLTGSGKAVTIHGANEMIQVLFAVVGVNRHATLARNKQH